MVCWKPSSSGCSGPRFTTPNLQGKQVRHTKMYQLEQPCFRTQGDALLSQRKRRNCMVQHPSPVAWTWEPQAEQPGHLHTVDTGEERVVASQAVCTRKKRHLLL